MKKCRICHADLFVVQDKLVLHDCPLTDQFINPRVVQKEFIDDITVVQCPNCGCIQNPANIDYSEYYLDYEYSSAKSSYTQRFMDMYSQLAIRTFSEIHQRPPKSVIEAGSGDGAQLEYFKAAGCEVIGIEPSDSLAKTARSREIETIRSLFNMHLAKNLTCKADICISSYTLDHCPDPVDYLIAANSLLIESGLCIFEIHDFELIHRRTEYSLFEHEHTVYFTAEKVAQLVEACGFEVLKINPLPQSVCRANSLIILARKLHTFLKSSFCPPVVRKTDKPYSLADLQCKIERFVEEVDSWIRNTDGTIVGYGAGGRGIMTLAQLSSNTKFSALLDLAFDGRSLLAPKTLIPICGPSSFQQFKEATALVFSYGYFEEIQASLVKAGFTPSKVVSLKSFIS